MDILTFRARMQTLKNSPRADLEKWLDQNWADLPPFPSGNEVFHDEIKGVYSYKGHYYKDRPTPCFNNWEPQDIDPLLCVGTSWLYRNDHSEGKPILKRLLKGLSSPHENAPPVYSTRVGDYYLCDDGNHRIYVAYLLGSSVKIVVDSVYEEIGMC